MATVTAFTAARMQQIEDSTVVSGFVDINGRLLLETRVGTEIDAGSVRGETGPSGVGPTGTVTMFAGLIAPLGHLLCEGQAVSRTAYSTLFSVIGTLYGAGDGSTTFNLPLFKGRVPVGRDSSQTEFDTLGEIGGEKTHLLTAAESGLVGHNHLQDVHNHLQDAHTHIQPAHEHAFQLQYKLGGVAGVNGEALAGSSIYYSTPQAWNAAPAQTTSQTTPTNNNTTATNKATTATNQAVASAAASAEHNNLQPYTVVNYIIKT